MTLAILHTIIALCAVLVIVIAVYAIERNCRTPQRAGGPNRRTGPGCVPADLFQDTLEQLARELDGLPDRQSELVYATAAASVQAELASRPERERAERMADQWRSDTGLLRGRLARTDWQNVIANPIKRTRPAEGNGEASGCG